MEQTIKQLKNQARKLQPCLRIGKAGITDTIIAELKNQLKHQKLIKIKLLSAALEEIDRKLAGSILAEKTNSCHVQTIGNCVVLCKR